MPKIKIIEVLDTNGCDGYELTKIVSVTDNWEEVSEEEYTYLKNNLHIINTNFYNKKYVLCQDKTVETPLLLKEIKVKIEEKLAAKSIQQKKHEESIKKAQETKKQKQIEKAKRLLKDAKLL